jgi:predicted RNA binding protein YcfA (HicA-like mRNA interferase family)
LPKQPVISGEKLVKVLKKLGYSIIRQRGSHIMLRKSKKAGEHNIIIPNHPEIAKGTLNDIITKVAIWNNVSKDYLLNML